MADYILSHTGAELDAAITKALSMGELEDKTATPSLTEQVITASEGKTLDSVTVGAVTGSLVSSLDSNFTAANIASGVTILGVTGTYGGSGGGTAKTYNGSFDVNNTSSPWPGAYTYVSTDFSGNPSGGMLALHIGVQGTSNSFCQVFTLDASNNWESFTYAGLNSYTVSVSGQVNTVSTPVVYEININVTTSVQNTTASYQIVLW